jgi:cardiolipin synthase
VGSNPAVPTHVPSPARKDVIGVARTTDPSDRVLTVPNVISGARLLAVPVFGWLLATGQDRAALVLLIVSSVSDFADGWLARRLDQVSRLGILLDPIADRAYVLVAVVVLTWRGVLPWELLAVLAARDLVLALNVVVLRSRGIAPLPVHLVGKAATFVLLIAFPLLILTQAWPSAAGVLEPLSWAALLWGTWLYWWAGIGYLAQAGRVLRSGVQRVVPA